ncbi:MAG: sulfatase-like hydrolase/transferase, partial [Alphaproteobacteria bacterium]
MGLVLATLAVAGISDGRAGRRVGRPADTRGGRADSPVDAPRNAVTVLVDTLRPDHLGAWGYAGGTSPAIDELARRGIVFENARSVAPWTGPTIATLFQGRYPLALLAPVEDERLRFGPLPPAPATLAEKMRAAGLRTFALCDHPGLRPEDG